MLYRIPKIEALEPATKLKVLGLRKNLIKKIEGLDQNKELEELELPEVSSSPYESISSPGAAAAAAGAAAPGPAAAP